MKDLVERLPNGVPDPAGEVDRLKDLLRARAEATGIDAVRVELPEACKCGPRAVVRIVITWPTGDEEAFSDVLCDLYTRALGHTWLAGEVVRSARAHLAALDAHLVRPDGPSATTLRAAVEAYEAEQDRAS